MLFETATGESRGHWLWALHFRAPACALLEAAPRQGRPARLPRRRVAGRPWVHSSLRAPPAFCASAENLDEPREEQEKSPPEPHTPPSSPVKLEEGEPQARPSGEGAPSPGAASLGGGKCPDFVEEERPSVAGAELTLTASARLHGASVSLAHAPAPVSCRLCVSAVRVAGEGACLRP